MELFPEKKWEMAFPKNKYKIPWGAFPKPF